MTTHYQTTTPQLLLRPDTLLYIYYLEGSLPSQLHVASDAFVGNWVEDNSSFLFFTKPSGDVVTKILTKYPDISLLDKYEMPYQQWQGGAIEPIRIGRFLLNPPWISASPSENDISITLNSGVVFGNGGHTTTQACLEAIEIACSGNKVTTMLDLGCGTGVLALAGAKLGCEKVLAIDYNYLAAQTTKHNVSLNSLDNTILVANGKAEHQTSCGTDLLVANIHYDVMKEIVATKGFLKQKWFILSGLLASETQKILAILEQKPVHILKRWNQDSIWHTIMGITAVQ